MYSKEQISRKIQTGLVWIVFAQLGLLCGIEGIYIAAFSGIEEFDEAYGNPSLSMVGLATSMYPIMAAVGALSILVLVRVMSENFLIIIAMYVWLAGYLVGSICFGKMAALVVARVMKGLSIGFITSVIPLYAEKISPNRQHAAHLLTLFQAAVPLGILIMALIGKLATSKSFTERWIYVAIPVYPACLFVLYVPRSRSHANVELSAPNMAAPNVAEKNKTWIHLKSDLRTLFQSRSATMRFTAASLAQFASPLTAINIIFYYSSTMCRMLGFNQQDAGYMAMGLYGCNFLGTSLSLIFINRLPRVATISYSILSMAILHGLIFLILMVQSQWPDNSIWGLIAIAILFAFVLVFALLFAGISLVYTSEVVCPKSRGISIGLATTLGWVVNFAISMAAPAIMDKIAFYIFLLFSYICCALYVAFSLMPKPYNGLSLVNDELKQASF